MAPGDAVVVYGASGHGKVVADIIARSGQDVLGYLDDDTALTGTTVGQRIVLGTGEWLATHGRAVKVALGIGSNGARRRVADKVIGSGASLYTAIHPSAVVASSASIDEGTVVMAGAVLNPDCRVGVGAIINTHAVVEHDCVIGDWAHLSPNSALGGAARVGVLSHVGLGAVVLPGVSVGNEVVVGAGSVVNRSLPDGVTAYGVPARVRIA